MINESDLIDYGKSVANGLSYTAKQVADFKDQIRATGSTDQPSEVEDERELLVLNAMIAQLKKKRDSLMDRNRSEDEKKRHALMMDLKRHMLAMLPPLKDLPALSGEEEKRRFAYERVAKRQIAEPPQFKTGDHVVECFKGDDPHRDPHHFLVETHTIGDTKMVWLKHDTKIVLTMTMNHAMLCFKRIEKRPASPVVAIGEDDEPTPLLELDDDEGLSSVPVTQAALDDELPPKKRQRRDDEGLEVIDDQQWVACDYCGEKNINPEDLCFDKNLADIGGGYAHESCMTEEQLKEWEKAAGGSRF